MRARARENGSGHFHRSICVTYIKFPLAHACACTSSGLLLSCSCSSAPWNIRTPPCPTPSFDKKTTLNPKPSLEPSFDVRSPRHVPQCLLQNHPIPLIPPHTPPPCFVGANPNALSFHPLCLVTGERGEDPHPHTVLVSNFLFLNPPLSRPHGLQHRLPSHPPSPSLILFPRHPNSSRRGGASYLRSTTAQQSAASSTCTTILRAAYTQILPRLSACSLSCLSLSRARRARARAVSLLLYPLYLAPRHASLPPLTD